MNPNTLIDRRWKRSTYKMRNAASLRRQSNVQSPNLERAACRVSIFVLPHLYYFTILELNIKHVWVNIGKPGPES